MNDLFFISAVNLNLLMVLQNELKLDLINFTIWRQNIVKLVIGMFERSFTGSNEYR